MNAVRTVRVGRIGAEPSPSSRTELDSHADTSVVGQHALILHDYERPVNVIGYDSKQGAARNMRTVSAAVAYDDPNTGNIVILALHQAIFIPHLEVKLVCPL